ncbi:MAG: CBS domain-containing protein [Candidatus Altiarchaeales archaeon]|nr:CBS domain-containing protein [Candidatus Altiarchaeales archaeon]MBD3416157.1 CBS domain-containing protein [Candidatus Altiarchaeales archaeon]
MVHERISDIMTHRVITVNESMTVYDAACAMASKNVGSILITEKASLKGILTERDILRQIGQGNNVDKMLVSDLMTKNVMTVTSDTRISDAGRILVEHRFRRLPVVDGGVLVGIVTSTDLVFELNSHQISGHISDYMSTTTYTVRSSASVGDAVEVMIKNNIGSVIVVDDDDIKGILTERDVLKAVVAKKKSSDTIISEVMSRNTLNVHPDTQISHACHLMYYNGIRRFPVVDYDHKLAGMITERDLLQALIKLTS